LIELLVAFVIAALALTLILRIFSGGMRTLHLTDQYGRAAALAEARLATLGTLAPVTAGEWNGEVEGLRWQLEVLPQARGSARGGRAPTLYHARATVEWTEPGQGRPRAVELQTLRLVREEIAR
jgi:general secretion pathway protein I